MNGDTTTAGVYPPDEPGKPRGTRDRILEYVIHVIETEGEQAVKVLDLSRTTGISMGSIYHFFSEREDLIVHALAEIYRRSVDTPLAGFADALDVAADESTFRDIVVRYLELMNTPEALRRRQMRAVVYSTLTTRPALLEKVRESHRAIDATLDAIIRAAQARGLVRADLDVEAFVAWWQGMVVGQVLADTGLSDIEFDRWLTLAKQAIFTLAFGEAPGRS